MRFYKTFVGLFEAIPYAVIAFVARFTAAVPFWRSGQSKLEGGEIFGIKWNVLAIKESKFYLFEHQYGFPEAIAPAATYMAALGENLLPVFLVVGLASRLSALGLLGMTVVIQFYVFPQELLNPNGNWSLHLLWAMPLLLIVARGPGALSLDAVAARPR